MQQKNRESFDKLYKLKDHVLEDTFSRFKSGSTRLVAFFSKHLQRIFLSHKKKRYVYPCVGDLFESVASRISEAPDSAQELYASYVAKGGAVFSSDSAPKKKSSKRKKVVQKDLSEDEEVVDNDDDNEVVLPEEDEDEPEPKFEMHGRDFVDCVLTMCDLTDSVDRNAFFSQSVAKAELVHLLNNFINSRVISVTYAARSANRGSNLLTKFISDGPFSGTPDYASFSEFASGSNELQEFVSKHRKVVRKVAEEPQRRASAPPPVTSSTVKVILKAPPAWIARAGSTATAAAAAAAEEPLPRPVSAPRRSENVKRMSLATVPPTASLGFYCGEIGAETKYNYGYFKPKSEASDESFFRLITGGRQIIPDDPNLSVPWHTSQAMPGKLSYRRDYLNGSDCWRFYYVADSGPYCSASTAQNLLLETFHSTINKVVIKLPGSDQFVPRFIAPVLCGRLIRPSSALRAPYPGSVSNDGTFPGFFTPLSPEQRKHLASTFDDQNPCCASGVACLYRREFAEDKDGSLFRDIFFCDGRVPIEKAKSTPSLIDSVNLHDARCQVFVEIYKALEKLGFPHDQKFMAVRPVSFQTPYTFKLYPLTLPTGQVTIGLAVMLSEQSREKFSDVMARVQVKLFSLASTFFSVWYVPRVVRIFQSTLMASTSTFQRYGYGLSAQDIFSNDTSDHAVFLYHAETRKYLQADAAMIQALEATKFASFWCEPLSKITPSGNLSFGVALPCSISSKEYDAASPPKLWYHAACLNAEKDTTRSTAAEAEAGVSTTYKCPCCDEFMHKCYLDGDSGTFPKGSTCAGKYPRNMIDAFGKTEITFGAENFLLRCTMPSAIQTLPTPSAVDSGFA